MMRLTESHVAKIALAIPKWSEKPLGLDSKGNELQ